MSTSELSYDEVPYPELCHPYTHPSRLAAIAGLVDLAPAPPQSCRVLELGCAGGGNLIPMAYGLPGSTFVGIDLSPRQIASAGELARRVGVSNVELHALDLMDVTDQLGTFDYIIAHGLYSWVPDAVKDQLLAVCRRHLAPAGIAYVSYNTLPGWHSMQMLREVMLHETRHITGPAERARAARATVVRLRAMLPERSALPFAVLLDAYLESRLHRFNGNTAWEDSALLHDELGAINDPRYLHQFVAHARRHHLRHLTDATFPKMTAPGLSSVALAALIDRELDPIEREQQLDYVVQRSFRRSLLCHQEVELRRTRRAVLLDDLFIAVSHPGHGRRSGGSGPRDPLTLAALDHLEAVAPRAVHFAELLVAACAHVGAVEPDEAAAARLSAGLLEATALGQREVTLLAHAPALTPFAGDRPLASPIARVQAARSAVVGTLCHETIDLDGLQRVLLPLLDGRRRRGDLRSEVQAMIAAGRFGRPREDVTAAQLTDELEASLGQLGRAGVLLA